MYQWPGEDEEEENEKKQQQEQNEQQQEQWEQLSLFFTYQSQNNRNILLQLGFFEMFIHWMSTRQQLQKVVMTNKTRNA